MLLEAFLRVKKPLRYRGKLSLLKNLQRNQDRLLDTSVVLSLSTIF